MVEKQRSDILKIIAIISMLIDHVGYTFFPQLIIFRIIGRIAFPIFTYQIAEGYAHTTDKKKYMIRIWVFAAISQAPFSLLFQTTTLNVIVTLGLALFAIDSYHQKRYWLMLPPMAASFLVPMDYGLFGVLLALAFYAFRDNKWISILVQIFMICAFTALNGWPIEYYAVIGSLLVIFLPVQFFRVRIPKYFFYWFYPVHLIILYVLRLTLCGGYF